MNQYLVFSHNLKENSIFDKTLSQDNTVRYLSDRISLFEFLNRVSVDIVFFDVDYCIENQIDIIKLLNEIKNQNDSQKFVIVANQSHFDTIKECIKQGFDSILLTPFNQKDIQSLIHSQFILEREKAELDFHRTSVAKAKLPSLTDSANKTMLDIFAKADDVASTKSTVLILGETGVGKSELAKYIHRNSHRGLKQFIHVHCGAIPEGLIESELFGHEKGAFTGAIKQKMGKFELAHQGTLFLDEVSTLSLSAQIKLLTVLQDSIFQRVGGERDIKVDLRVIAATNENLQSLVDEGKFRRDLFYRLNVFPLEIPKLSERPEDIPLIVDKILNKLSHVHNKKMKTIQTEALDYLKSYHWPGNIRELENIIERSFIIEKSSILTVESLPVEIINFKKKEISAILPLNTNLSLAEARNRSIEIFERQYLKEVLFKTQGRISQASELSGVGVRQFSKLMNKYNLKKEDFKNTVVVSEDLIV
jgi:DNA-binding NtrC family response regulator